MKRIILLLASLLIFNQGVSLFAQETEPKFIESEYYYHSFDIEKIYAHRLGYVVLYRSTRNQVVRTLIPEYWFNDVAAKGEIIRLGPGMEWPSMTVWYKNGEFSHVRLKVFKDRNHETWGMVPLNVNMDEYFEDIQEVQLIH